ncbi:MAG TPA: dTDP-glucose 4,6-dehydratase [Vicinamibacterales bacterium]|jgi:dTDP-glucose 4,6-dehydratase|nr:dTDP-glucose 4,6-dehydratase [Vicinamibacterales bacterium]
MLNVLVTGGAGFIGSNFVRYALAAHQDWQITNLDKLTYAGRMETLNDVIGDRRHTFVHGDVADAQVAAPLVKAADIVVHFAAETHVDRAILEAGDFIKTDVIGTFVLLEAARASHKLRCFIQISTDEVYGSVPEGSSVETDELRPRNPYSASKAGADRLAYSYWATYNVPVMVTRASNNYGPYQFPEKVIPLFITNALDNIPVPLYGTGLNIRDWLHVGDHCRGIDTVIERGKPGDTYNIGGGNEVRNLDLTYGLLHLLDRPDSLIKKVQDRPGHDMRYSLDTAKLRQLGWAPQVAFDEGLKETVDWYRKNEWWWRPIKELDPAFRAYYQAQYGSRA